MNKANRMKTLPHFAISAMCTIAQLASGQSWSGALPADRGPSNSLSVPVVVSKRQLVTVQVSGSIVLRHVFSSVNCIPSGTGNFGFGPVWRGVTPGVAVLKIGENEYPIEAGARTFVVPHSGPLSLFVNDPMPDDNSGAFSVSIVVGPAIVGDADQDDLPDALEDALLDAYAPHFRLDTDNDEGETWPCSAYWFLRNSEPEASGNVLVQRERAPFHPEWYLTQRSTHPCCPGASTNMLDAYRDVGTQANINSDFHRGEGCNRLVATGNLGLYGRVVPAGSERIALQYWQLWGFSDIDTQGPDAGEHEGDWEVINVFVDQTAALNAWQSGAPFTGQMMCRVEWHAHGYSPAGAIWDPSVAEWPGGWWWTREDSSAPQAPLPARPAQHPDVYVEADSHGFWPVPWYLIRIGRNRGNGHSYIPTSVENVGEVFRPRLGSELVVQYNGQWGGPWDVVGFDGDPPDAPPLQSRWIPGGPSAEARYVGPWNHGQVHPNGIAPRGRISWPHPNLAEAAAANAGTPGREILIYPGSYPGAVTITTPTTLRAPHGTITLGRP